MTRKDAPTPQEIKAALEGITSDGKQAPFTMALTECAASLAWSRTMLASLPPSMNTQISHAALVAALAYGMNVGLRVGRMRQERDKL